MEGRMKAVIQCGGRGTRLQPYTTVLPKPLMPIGTKPILELLLKWLRRNGIRDVYISTGYLGHLIQSYCGDGRQWDLKIEYTEEREPLGTMGALGLLRDKLDATFLVLNGDILTDLNLNSLAAHHRIHGAGLTVSTVSRNIRVDFGLIEEANSRVVRFREKPTLSHLVSMGVYCLEPELIKHIPRGVPFGFDDLMFRMLEYDLPISTFLHKGFWLDIGRLEDFQKAQELGWDHEVPAYETAALSLEMLEVV
jgi:NDP-sugar pyrophosphorylase family protein